MSGRRNVPPPPPSMYACLRMFVFDKIIALMDVRTRTQNIGRRVSKQKCSYLTQLASQKKKISLQISLA